ncbi:MAG TPA: hypothetical protein VK832_08960 [Burkholderiaceae bacterium]|jgi:hypothetical protein|nr:hypothetical protein [Burkholderiaceae bacterium]
MHAAIELAAYWAIAFLTLSAAVILLNIFCNVINSDMEMLSTGKEAVISGLASLIEAVGLWLIITFVPDSFRAFGLRAMIVPLIITALIYKVMHLESWGIFEIGLLLAFQLAVVCLTASLLTGHFLQAFIVVVISGMILAVIASFANDL